MTIHECYVGQEVEVRGCGPRWDGKTGTVIETNGVEHFPLAIVRIDGMSNYKRSDGGFYFDTSTLTPRIKDNTPLPLPG